MTAPMTNPLQGEEVDPLGSGSASPQNPAQMPPLATARSDEPKFLEVQYASFLVRLWRKDEPATGDEWHGEVEHIQSGRRLAFASVSDLWELLSQPFGAGD